MMAWLRSSTRGPFLLLPYSPLFLGLSLFISKESPSLPLWRLGGLAQQPLQPLVSVVTPPDINSNNGLIYDFMKGHRRASMKNL